MMLRRMLMAGGGSSQTDDFSVDTLSDYTEFADSAANWSISGGALTASTGSQSVLARNGVSFANGEVSAVITEAVNTGLVLRLADLNNYYLAVIQDDSTPPGERNRIYLYKRVGGSFTQIGSTVSIPTFTRGTPTSFALRAIGSTLQVRVNGVTYMSRTDTSITAAGLCGMRHHSSLGPSKFDSFTWPG